MKTYLVAGGAGFIGSHLCDSLIEKGNKVICIDNLITGSKNNVEHLMKNENFSFKEADISGGKLVIDEEIDGIFHLASPASPNVKSPKSYMSYPIETLLANSQGTKNLLDLAREKNARFVYASTSEIYGDPEVSPQKEDYFGNVNPNGPRSVYDEAKRFGEAITMAYKRQYDLDVRIMRIFNTYGERMQKDDGRVVSDFIVQAIANSPLTVYGDGSQTRSFCYISDLVKGIVSMMETDGISGEVVNLGNTDEYTVLDLAEKIKRMVGSTSEISYEELPEDDPKKRKPDISKAERLLSFKPSVTLDEGLSKTIEYFRRI